MTQTGAMIGTLLYMSPEQVQDSKHLDYKTDIYSLAVTFVHLLTGKAPYDSTTSNDYEIRKGIVEQNLDLSSIPAAWRGFLKPYLAKSPAGRPELKPFEDNVNAFTSTAASCPAPSSASYDETVAEVKPNSQTDRPEYVTPIPESYQEKVDNKETRKKKNLSRKVIPQSEKLSPTSAVTVLDKYPDTKFIRDAKRNLIPKWFWWTSPIQLGAMFFSLGGVLILLWAFYHFRRKAVKNYFMEETKDKFIRISNLYKLGIYNRRTMRIILPIEYDSIDKTDSGAYLIKKGEKLGLFWKKRKIVPAEYDKIAEIEPGVFVVEKAGLVGAINDGKVFIPTQYDRIEIKKDDLYSAIKGSEIRYYTKDGAVS